MTKSHEPEPKKAVDSKFEFNQDEKDVLKEELLLKQELNETAKVMEEAKAGRLLGDITLNDPYWEAKNRHSEAYTKWVEYCKHNTGVE